MFTITQTAMWFGQTIHGHQRRTLAAIDTSAALALQVETAIAATNGHVQVAHC